MDKYCALEDSEREGIEEPVKPKLEVRTKHKKRSGGSMQQQVAIQHGRNQMAHGQATILQLRVLITNRRTDQPFARVNIT